jgi:hypothetical protein
MVCLIQKLGNKSHLFGKENGKKKIGTIDIGFGNADNAGASKSLSVRTFPTTIC